LVVVCSGERLLQIEQNAALGVLGFVCAPSGPLVLALVESATGGGELVWQSKEGGRVAQYRARPCSLGWAGARIHYIVA